MDTSWKEESKYCLIYFYFKIIVTMVTNIVILIYLGNENVSVTMLRDKCFRNYHLKWVFILFVLIYYVDSIRFDSALNKAKNHYDRSHRNAGFNITRNFNQLCHASVLAELETCVVIANDVWETRISKHARPLEPNLKANYVCRF